MTEIDRRQFIKLTGAGMVAAILGGAAIDKLSKNHEALVVADQYSGLLTELLKENSEPLLKDYASNINGSFKGDGGEIVNKAVGLQLPTNKGRIMNFKYSSLLIGQEGTTLVVVPSADSFNLDDQNKLLVADTGNFKALLYNGQYSDLSTGLQIDSIRLRNASVMKFDLLGNVFPGLTEDRVNNLWPGSDYSPSGDKGWYPGVRYFAGYQIEDGANWEPVGGGEQYSLAVQKAGVAYELQRQSLFLAAVNSLLKKHSEF